VAGLNPLMLSYQDIVVAYSGSGQQGNRVKPVRRKEGRQFHHPLR
jgi:hypothetical protein